MNEFTKKDLEIIAKSLVALYSNPKVSLNKPDIDLVNKIESMINNYCEHENTVTDSAMIECCVDCNWSGFK